MAQNSMNYRKVFLEDSDLLPRTFEYEECSGIFLTLYVKNYSSLESNVIYYVSTTMRKYRWTLKLVISNETLFAFMATNTDLEFEGCALYKTHGRFVAHTHIEEFENLEIIEFCHKAIMDPENDYLNDDCLLLEFKYILELPVSDHSSLLKLLIDRATYTEDFKGLYLPSCRYDVEIMVQEETYFSHRNMLARHSRVFDYLFKNHQLRPNKRGCTVLKLEEEPRYFGNILSLIYTTESMDLDDSRVMELYRIANILQMDFIKELCMEHFQFVLSPLNEMHIFVSATMYKLNDLKNETVRYMKQRNSNSLRSSVFKKILKFS